MRSLAVAVLAPAWLLSVPAANAQEVSRSPGLSDRTPNIPDQKLDAAAAALEEVASVKQNYQQRIETAAPSDKTRIADEVHGALVKAVTGHGLSVEEFTSIVMVAQSDPAVREKLIRRMHPSAE